MNLLQIKEAEKSYLWLTYKRQEVIFVKGKGVHLFDLSGKKYLDFLCGISTTSLGHSHPKVVNAIKAQSRKLIHTSNLFYTLPQIRLAKSLFNLTRMKAFFCNSGAEANEGAIKLARKWGKQNGERFEIITAYNSFHGRTLTTLTATGQEKYQKDFLPLTPGFKYVKFNDIDDLKKLISEKTVAVMLELIQGESGVIIGEEKYIKEVREICSKKNILLIIDEVQTALGRCGKMFCYENYNIVPDVVTLAKSLGQGYPIGVALAKPEVANIISPGDHASTFGGGPVATKVAEVVLKTIKEEHLCEGAEKKGEYFLQLLNNLKEKHPIITEVRGKGLMIAVELNKGISSMIVKQCLEKYLIINATSDYILRFLPPLIVTKKQINKAVKILDSVLENTRYA